MFNRGSRIKIDSESESDNGELEPINEEDLEIFQNSSQNFSVSIRPANLILPENNFISCQLINSNPNNTCGNGSKALSNVNMPNNGSIINAAAGASGAPAAAAVPISEIKEYLEMIPTFKGESELLPLFIKEASKIIRHFYDGNNPDNPRNDFITSRIRAKVQGEAALYLANRTINRWDDLRVSLIAAYADKRDDATLTLELVKLEQGSDSPFEYFKKIQKLLNAQICYANLNYGENTGLNDHFQKVALKTLLNGLKDPLGSLMRTKDPQDLDTALNLLTNTYQKEIQNQKFNKSIISNINNNNQKPRPNLTKPNFSYPMNFAPPFVATPSSSNANNFHNSFGNSNQNISRPQAMKRPANFNHNFNNQYPQFSRQNSQNNQVTPMSISTANTYRPPVKVRPSNYNSHETYEIENENLDQLYLNDNINCVNETELQNDAEATPYNNFLEETASDNFQNE